MKKIDRGQAFIQANYHLFTCPVCHQEYQTTEDYSLVCPNGHRIDLSRKGTLYFMQRAVDTEYDDQMLQARRRILTAGLFDGITDAFGAAIPAGAQRILDVGCGEGTPLARVLSQRRAADVAIGFDISKAGINLATQLSVPAFFCVADLAAMPFSRQAFTVILDLFSPSAYQEFKRVLAPGGRLLKVVPNADYLGELRQLLYADDTPQAHYSNQRVIELFMAHYPHAQQQRVRYTVPIEATAFADLLVMTPLHWGASATDLDRARQQPLTAITVDVTLLTAIG